MESKGAKKNCLISRKQSERYSQRYHGRGEGGQHIYGGIPRPAHNISGRVKNLTRIYSNFFKTKNILDSREWSWSLFTCGESVKFMYMAGQIYVREVKYTNIPVSNVCARRYTPAHNICGRSKSKSNYVRLYIMIYRYNDI